MFDKIESSWYFVLIQNSHQNNSSTHFLFSFSCWFFQGLECRWSWLVIWSRPCLLQTEETS